MIQADLNTILPEIILAVFAMLGLVAAVYTSKDKLAPVLVWVTGILMVLLAIWIGAAGGVGSASPLGSRAGQAVPALSGRDRAGGRDRPGGGVRPVARRAEAAAVSLPLWA